MLTVNVTVGNISLLMSWYLHREPLVQRQRPHRRSHANPLALCKRPELLTQSRRVPRGQSLWASAYVHTFLYTVCVSVCVVPPPRFPVDLQELSLQVMYHSSRLGGKTMLPTISDYKPTTVFLSQEFEMEFSPKYCPKYICLTNELLY